MYLSISALRGEVLLVLLLLPLLLASIVEVAGGVGQAGRAQSISPFSFPTTQNYYNNLVVVPAQHSTQHTRTQTHSSSSSTYPQSLVSDDFCLW